ncbi:MAG: VWA domain-containing protein, partial [Candidatus Aenigmarchaeota archaeon]|nr:VWA domain-containing protein [Candidatus Aenigmarchaeota archaeon]
MDLRKQKALPLLLVSMFLLATAIGMPVVASTQSPNDVVAGPVVVTAEEATAPIGTLDTPYCGPIDLTIALDDTGSMGGAIGNIKTELSTIMAAALDASGDDLRVGYMTFKDNVVVHN